MQKLRRICAAHGAKESNHFSDVGALRKHARGMFLAADLGGYAAVASIWICVVLSKDARSGRKAFWQKNRKIFRQ